MGPTAPPPGAAGALVGPAASPLGAASFSSAGIATIDITDPTPADAATPIPMRAGDFPATVEIRYRYPDAVPAGTVRANLDDEILSAGFDDLGRFGLGGLDELGDLVPGELVILQCDRGLTAAIGP